MAYGQTQYGVLQFGEEPPTDNPSTPFIPDLMRYLPFYYTNSRVIKSLISSTATEIGALRYTADDLLKQFFVSTATWGLDLWEKELGLDTDSSKSYVHRREMILAKLRGTGTTTKQMIKNAAMAFSGGEVEVIEYPAESRFVVQFIGVMGIPQNMPGFTAMLDQIKPAHLAYEFKYTFTVWEMIEELTWGAAHTKTWGQLKTYEGGTQ